MVWDFKAELRRKVIHLLSLFFIIIFMVASATLGKQIALFVLVLLLIVFLELDYVRVELNKKIPFFDCLWRLKEKNHFGGQVFFLIGAIISLAVFDFKIALSALLMTTFGDMAAALVGKRFGSIWVSKTRAWEGILAEFIVDAVIAYIILDSWVMILVMSLTATAVESLSHKLDDNLLIPLFAGVAGQIVEYVTKLF